MWDDIKKRKKRRGRRLRDIDVDEISLVSQGANRKRFFIIKSDQEVLETMEELEQLINEFNPEGYEVEILRKAKDKLPKDMLNELTKAYKVLVKYMDDLPSDLKEGIDILGKYASYGYGSPEGKGIKKSVSWPSVIAQIYGAEEEEESDED